MRIFIIEDDIWYSEILVYHLSLNPDYEIHKFNTAAEALLNLHLKPDVITLDYSLDDARGDEVLKKIKAYNPEIDVIIISGQEDVSTAIGLLREGAFDYFVKDDEVKDRLWNALIKIRDKKNLQKQVEDLTNEVVDKYEITKTIIGNSTAIKQALHLVQKATKTNITVSINGETGTGKELIAKAIHYHSERAKKPFVAVNVAAIPKDLMESELFGYEKGAFTGALNRRIGKFEEANKGTLFLDEIGELDLNLQSKLLRALQEKEITRIGGSGTISIDARIIVATHKNLQQEVVKGNFREDLYYRLLGLPIYLPPLRERGNDVLLIAKAYSDRFCKENKLSKKQISQDAQQKLLSYPFPGNVRELAAIMHLAVVLCEGDCIQADDITFQSSDTVNNLLLNERTLEDYNKLIIEHFLQKYGNDVLLVAKKLNIGKSTLYRMIQSGLIKHNK
jgi:two-component system, NtrC family, response regulator AtoC